jgi:hypothetical protein
LSHIGFEHWMQAAMLFSGPSNKGFVLMKRSRNKTVFHLSVEGIYRFLS